MNRTCVYQNLPNNQLQGVKLKFFIQPALLHLIFFFFFKPLTFGEGLGWGYQTQNRPKNTTEEIENVGFVGNTMVHFLRFLQILHTISDILTVNFKPLTFGEGLGQY